MVMIVDDRFEGGLTVEGLEQGNDRRRRRWFGVRLLGGRGCFVVVVVVGVSCGVVVVKEKS